MKNVSFFSYLLTLNQSTVRQVHAKNLILQLLYTIAFGFVAALFTNFSILILIFGFTAFFAAVPQSWARRVKPNLSSLIPLSQKRKTVYTVLSIPAMFVVLSVLCIAMLVTIWTLSGLAASAIVGDIGGLSLFLWLYIGGLVNVFADGYAAGFFVSLFIYIFGSGIIYSFSDGKKFRNITAVVLFIAAVVGGETLMQVAFGFGGQTETHIAGFAGMYIKFLPLPWLAVTLCAMVSLCVLAFGIYLVISKCRPKNY